MKVSEFKTAGKLITGLGAIKALTDEMAKATPWPKTDAHVRKCG